MVKRSGKAFDLKKFIRDYPIVPALLVVFLTGVWIGFNLGQVAKPRLQVEKPAQAHTVKAPALPEKAVETPREAKTTPFLFFPLKRAPRIAFVIDDVGNSKHYADLLFSFPRPVTLAILPQLAFSEYFAVEAKKRGIETILHLPLEPDDRVYKKPGAGEIKTSMSENEIKRILAKNLESVPGVTGANNHMGSHVTRNPRLMSVILTELKNQKLFFLDSMTHPDSIAHEKAREFGMKVLKRDVFIDNNDNYQYVLKQIKQVAEVAKHNGSAVAIGHVHENTLRALKDAMPELEQEGIEIVNLKDLL